MRQLGPTPGSPPGGEDVNGLLYSPHALTRKGPGVKKQCRSGRFAVEVSQHAAESLAADNFTSGTAHFLARLDQSVIEPLMVSLLVIMSKIAAISVVSRSLAVRSNELRYNRIRFRRQQ